MPSEGLQPFPMVPCCLATSVPGVTSLGEQCAGTAPEKPPQPFEKGKAVWGVRDLDPHFLCCANGFAEMRLKDF